MTSTPYAVPASRRPEALAAAAVEAAASLAARHRSAVLPWDAVVVAAASRAGGAADVGVAAVRHAIATEQLAVLDVGGDLQRLVGPPDVLAAERALAAALRERPSVTLEQVVAGPPSAAVTIHDLQHHDAATLLPKLSGTDGDLGAVADVLGRPSVDLPGALLEAGVPTRLTLPSAAARRASRRVELAAEVHAGDVRALEPSDRDVFVGAEVDRDRLVERTVRAVTDGLGRRLGLDPSACEVLTATDAGPVGAAALRHALAATPEAHVATVDTGGPSRPVVVLVLDRSHEALVDRAVLATAIDRARTALIVLGDPDVLRRGARRPAPRRWSTIAAQRRAMG